MSQKQKSKDIKREDVQLLFDTVRARFLHRDKDESDRAIITALEGLKRLLGDRNSPVTKGWMRAYLKEVQVERHRA